MKSLVKNIFHSMGFDIVRHPYTDITPQRDYLKLLDNHNVDLVLDVGANVGQYAADLFKIGYKGQVVSFEPMSKEYALLKKASERNAHWLVAERMAIGESNGTIEINISENSVSSSILPLTDYVKENSPSTRYVAKEEVKISTLSDASREYVAKAKNPFLKVDVQGYEEQVLKGAAELMPLLKGIHLEFSLKPLYQNESTMDVMMAMLKQWNFEPWYFTPHTSKDRSGRMMQVDGVFYKK